VGARVTALMTRGISRRSCQGARDKANRRLEAANGRRPSGRSTRTATVARAPGTCSRGMSGGTGPRTRVPEMGEEPLDDGVVIGRGHKLHPLGTARTAQEIQAEGQTRFDAAAKESSPPRKSSVPGAPV
jgi:hypothetical protein